MSSEIRTVAELTEEAGVTDADVRLRCPALGCDSSVTMDSGWYEAASATQVLTCPRCRLGHPTKEWHRA